MPPQKGLLLLNASNYTRKDKMLKRTNFFIYKPSRGNAFEEIQEIYMKIAKCNTNATTVLLTMVILCLVLQYVVFSKNFIRSRMKKLLCPILCKEIVYSATFSCFQSLIRKLNCKQQQ